MTFKIGDTITSKEVTHTTCMKMGAVFKIIEMMPTTTGPLFKMECQECKITNVAMDISTLKGLHFTKCDKKRKKMFKGWDTCRT